MLATQAVARGHLRLTDGVAVEACLGGQQKPSRGEARVQQHRPAIGRKSERAQKLIEIKLPLRPDADGFSRLLSIQWNEYESSLYSRLSVVSIEHGRI